MMEDDEKMARMKKTKAKRNTHKPRRDPARRKAARPAVRKATGRPPRTRRRAAAATRSKPHAAPSPRRVLVLGAGLVARPLIQYLLRRPGYYVAVADKDVPRAREMLAGRANAEALALDLDPADPSPLVSPVSRADVVVSLLPPAYHPTVAGVCVDRHKHLVTTSYVGDAMRALDDRAREAGVLLLNEVGLDPGLDHMTAMRIIDGVRERGGTVAEFYSYCGGLPAPEANTNPIGYKFSWNPRGMVLAGKNAARYLKDGRLVDIPGPELFGHYWEVKIDNLGVFEAYPNRDSPAYRSIYGIESARTVFRGTLRYLGHCRLWKKMVEMGLLDDAPRANPAGTTLAEFTRRLLGVRAGRDLRVAAAEKLGLPPDSEVLLKLDWLGFFGTDPVPIERGSGLDVLAAQLQKKLQYKRGERDMIVLRHEFSAEFPGGRRESITSTLIDFGVPGGDSAMSRTVSLPAAIAARLVLEGAIDARGVRIPIDKAIYGPILSELEAFGVRCVERTVAR